MKNLLSQGALVSSVRSCMTGYRYVDPRGCEVSFRVKGVYNTVDELVAGLRADRTLVAVRMVPAPSHHYGNEARGALVATMPAFALANALGR